MKTNNTARLISLVTVLAMMLVLCFAFATPASAASHEVTDKASLEAAIAAAKDGDVIYLTQDITLTDATATITIGQDVTITSKQDNAKEGTEIYTITRAVGGFPMFTIKGTTIVTLENITIDGDNTTSTGNGGGFGMDSDNVGRQLVIGEGATLKNLKATNGGAAYMRSVIVNGGTVENCSVSGTGGGLYVSRELIFTAGIFSTNSAKNGGALALAGGTADISGGVFEGNTCSGSGGAFYIGSGTLTFTGGEIKDNTATGNGGGIYFAGGSAHLLSGGTISGNTGKSGGGVATTKELTLGACTITGNTATGNGSDYGGGGIYSSAAGIVVINNGATVSKNGAVRGGGIFSLGTVTINDGATISENTASATGAGAQIVGTLTMNGGTVSKNTATTTGGGLQIMSKGVVTLNGGSIVDNVATTNGGGIYQSGTLSILGGSITSNDAKAGGGIYATAGFLMSGGTISENTASTDGAGVALPEGSEKIFDMSGGSITGNKAKSDGGGIYNAAGATVKISGTAEISKNTAGATGGGVASYAGYFIMTGGLIDDNTATGNGGGLYAKNGGYRLISGGTISNNHGNNGGGIASAAPLLVISGNASIVDNDAKKGGGGIYLGGSAQLVIVGGSMARNVAKANGSAIIASSGPTVVMMGGEIKTHGGAQAIYATGTSQIHLLGGSITGNSVKVAVASEATAPITLGKSFALAEALGDEVVTAISGSVTVSADSLTLTSTTPLEICDNTGANGNISGYVTGTSNTFNVTLAEDLVAGSRVEFNDNAETDGYFLTLAESFTPNDETLGAIDLFGADAQYAPKLADGALTWPEEAYQIYQSAALTESISFRVIFARRSAKNTTILDDVTVEQVVGEMVAAANWTEGTYNGSPCIVVSLAPKMAMDQIIVKKGDVAVKDEGYSFASYLKAMKENIAYNTDAELMALVDATLNYCAAAQNYFDYNNGTLANEGVTAKVLEIPEVSMTLNDPDKIFHSAQVDVASTVSVAIIAKGNVTPTVMVDGVEVQYELRDLKDAENESYTAIVIPDLAASVLTSSITVEIGGATLTYSVPAYAYNMQQKGENAELVSVVQALYAYATAAAEYAK